MDIADKLKGSVQIKLIAEGKDGLLDFYLKANEEKIRLYGPISQGQNINAENAVEGEEKKEISNFMQSKCPYIRAEDAKNIIELVKREVSQLIPKTDITLIGNYSLENFKEKYKL